MTLPLPEAGGDTPPIGERARVADNLGPEGPGRLFRLVKNHGALIQIDGQGGKVFRCRAIALGFEDGLQNALVRRGRVSVFGVLQHRRGCQRPWCRPSGLGQ